MATPMERQYNKLKKQYEDCILLFRLGDFYESFDNDAKIMSKVLGIVLTSRGKGEKKRPMAGVPHHALENYLPKLVEAGYKVAIAEQMEEPQKGKSVVDRDVVKVVTAGTLTNEKSLKEGENRFLSALTLVENKSFLTWGIASCDLSTGEFFISEHTVRSKDDLTDLLTSLNKIKPAEIIVSEELDINLKKTLTKASIQKFPSYEFDFESNKKSLLDHFEVKNLKGFGIEKHETGIISAGIILKYLKETQKTSLSHIKKIYYKNKSKFMLLDENTIRNLELVSPIRSDSETTLLKVIDKCSTPMGKRKLYNWILEPLVNSEDIARRGESVHELFSNSTNLKKIQNRLDEIYDIERILGKVGNETANAKDLTALKLSLCKILELKRDLSEFNSEILENIRETLDENEVLQDVISVLDKSIKEDPSNAITEGGIIKDGYSSKLDEIREVYKGGKNWLKQLESKEKKRTGILSLKVKFNKVFGYYIEVSKANLDRVPDDYVRKQTLANSERYFTSELKDKEEKLLSAEEDLYKLEYEIFIEIRNKIVEFAGQIQTAAQKVAKLDCLANFAWIARENQYTKPELLNDNSGKLIITEGRHPTVEKISSEPFIPNDVDLDTEGEQIAIITGPNMSGKSTYIRQVALITLLAQTGSFVPAEHMKFEPVDRIFTRVGANDNLAGGESTFLVEMNETANILNNATKHSLIILDEVGRGTSTYDGVAIAWAVSEYIHNQIGAKTLFATHYHELIDLKKYLPRTVNYNVSVKESDQKVVFLRKIERGSTDKSYGVHVAQLAGVPYAVVAKAQKVLKSLEQEGMFEVKHVETEIIQKKTPKETSQIQLLEKLPENPVVKELKEIDINKMTPFEALEKLNQIIQKVKK